MTKTLVPNIDRLIDNDLNVMLIGPHGVGKTFTLKEAAEKRGLKLKYYSCSTLDPFTDLVGIPYPDADGKNLHMIRPRDIDEANIIFFDELNRAQDTKTLNAILEIIQFKSINGERLPNLRSVWAAVNPAEDGTYQVHDLDPALEDRFHVYHVIKPTVSVDYLSQFMDKKIAQALSTWWTDRRGNKEAYISPRRMHEIGMIVDKTQDASIAKFMMPPGNKYDVTKLIYHLNVALGKAKANDGAFGAASGSIEYTKQFFKNNSKEVVKALKNNPSEDTLNKVVGVLESSIGGASLVSDYGDILDEIPASKLEAMINSFNPAKKSVMRGELVKKKNLKNLKKVLQVL